jgi:hypothetical protein
MDMLQMQLQLQQIAEACYHSSGPSFPFKQVAATVWLTLCTTHGLFTACQFHVPVGTSVWRREGKLNCMQPYNPRGHSRALRLDRLACPRKYTVPQLSRLTYHPEPICDYDLEIPDDRRVSVISGTKLC